MDNDKLLYAIFTLMQDPADTSSNIEEILEIMFDDHNIKLQDTDKAAEKFYNMLLTFLRSTPDDLWDSDEHRLIVSDIIREKLDQFSVNPTPYIKSKFYG